LRQIETDLRGIFCYETIIRYGEVATGKIEVNSVSKTCFNLTLSFSIEMQIEEIKIVVTLGRPSIMSLSSHFAKTYQHDKWQGKSPD
jgi:hypothetical protein